MRLDTEFIKLPFLYDVEQLQKEVAQFSDSMWIPHPLGFAGNLSIPLISMNGEINDAMCGPMKVTPALQQSPYIKQVIAQLGNVCGRSRLMRLEPGAEVPRHSDLNYHWHKHIRIHIPIFTDPQVDFWCADKKVNMAAGECWIFDTFKSHIVENKSQKTRIHLVIDGYGSPDFWRVVDQSEKPFAKDSLSSIKPEFVTFQPNSAFEIKTERYNAPIVLNPGEIEGLALNLIVDAKNNPQNSSADIHSCEQILRFFCYRWREIWALHGSSPSSWRYYRQALESLKVDAQNIKGKIMLASNGGDIMFPLFGHIINNAVNSHLYEDYQKIAENITLSESSFVVTDTPVDVNDSVHSKPKQAKMHRNDICYCGSGKRYKHCHGQ